MGRGLQRTGEVPTSDEDAMDGQATPHRHLSLAQRIATARRRRCAAGRLVRAHHHRCRRARCSTATPGPAPSSVDRANVVALVVAGRSRWKIENENNNTLKTKGYNFEHNYGHGKQHLAALLASLILLAFLAHTVLDLLDQRYLLGDNYT